MAGDRLVIDDRASMPQPGANAATSVVRAHLADNHRHGAADRENEWSSHSRQINFVSHGDRPPDNATAPS
jgi:hypothetical protein